MRELTGKLRFKLLTCAANRPAYDGCFTRTLVDCLIHGMDSGVGDFLGCDHVQGVIKEKCPAQDPQLLGYNDRGLFLGMNLARPRMSQGPLREVSRVSEEIRRLMATFQPTPILSQVVERAGYARGLMLEGVAGVGKSTLAAALALPESTEGAVPDGFVQAAAFFSTVLTTGELAETLAAQLDRSVPGFAQARDQFDRELTEDERRQLNRLQREVIGPLSRLASDGTVRIVLDGLDHVPPPASRQFNRASTPSRRFRMSG